MTDELRDQIAEAIKDVPTESDVIRIGYPNEHDRRLVADAVMAKVQPVIDRWEHYATEAMAEAEQLREANEVLEIDLRQERAIHAEAVQRFERAEAAVDRVTSTVARLRRIAVCGPDDDTGLSDDHYAGVERAADEVAAALNPAGGSEEKEDPKTTRDLLRELTHEAIDAGSYAEPMPPDPDPYGEPEITTVHLPEDANG